jgi:hypothetical protein
MTSIYIPRIDTKYDERSIVAAFANLGLAKVSRVDFVKLDDQFPRNGRFRMAFVHMPDGLYDTPIANDIRDAHVNNKGFHLYPDYPSFDAGIFWILLKNTRPVAETTLNVHQLAENHRILEETTTKNISALGETVSVLGETISKLEETVSAQADQIDRLQQTVYQLISCVNLPSEDINVFEKVLLNLDDNEEEEDYSDMPGLTPYEPGEKTLEQKLEDDFEDDFEKDFEMNMNICVDNDDCWMCDYLTEKGGKQCKECYLKSKGDGEEEEFQG